MLPQPVIALLLLFPITDQSEEASKAGEAFSAIVTKKSNRQTLCSHWNAPSGHAASENNDVPCVPDACPHTCAIVCSLKGMRLLGSLCFSGAAAA